MSTQNVIFSGIFPLVASSYDLGIQCLFAAWVFLPLSNLSLYFHMFWLWGLKALGLALVKVVCSVWIQAPRLLFQHTQYRPITHSARPFRGGTRQGLKKQEKDQSSFCGTSCKTVQRRPTGALLFCLSVFQSTRTRLGMSANQWAIHLSFSYLIFSFFICNKAGILYLETCSLSLCLSFPIRKRFYLQEGLLLFSPHDEIQLTPLCPKGPQSA